MACCGRGSRLKPKSNVNPNKFVEPKVAIIPKVITSDKSDALNDNLLVQVMDLQDEVTKTHYKYTILYKNTNAPGVKLHAINFQKGDVENGVNGISVESLLLVVKHHLAHTQPSKTNSLALEHLESTIKALSN